MSDLTVIRYRSQDPRLGRHVVHDERSRGFASPRAIDKSTWHDKSVRIYDPHVNPNQCHGECTGVAKSVMFNAVGNRKRGVVLNMDNAHAIYSLATSLDPWEGAWPPEDTGSSGLAAAKAAQQLGLGGEYHWRFDGADGVVQEIMSGNVVNVGTRWDWDMFHPDAEGIIRPGGGEAGGHEWSVRRYWKSRDLVGGRCWWGDFRDFWIARADLDALLADNGDAHTQARV